MSSAIEIVSAEPQATLLALPVEVTEDRDEPWVPIPRNLPQIPQAVLGDLVRLYSECREEGLGFRDPWDVLRWLMEERDLLKSAWASAEESRRTERLAARVSLESAQESARKWEEYAKTLEGTANSLSMDFQRWKGNLRAVGQDAFEQGVATGLSCVDSILPIFLLEGRADRMGGDVANRLVSLVMTANRAIRNHPSLRLTEIDLLS
ncbi:MAG TPA: hypothetical protein VFF67_06165 [Thermoplasmata archaeon]|nr:hypothetical protein [Thermoplasmata archaeon]